MPKTPDRHPGVASEEGTVYESTVVSTQQGEVRYDGSKFSMYDAVGEFDPRSGTDAKDVKVSSNDTTSAFLDTKLVAGTNVTLTELNDGGAETLEIAASGAGVPTPVQMGEVLFSRSSTTLAFTVELPLTSCDGWLVDDQGIHVVVG